MSAYRFFAWVGSAALAATISHSVVSARELSLDERVDAQKAIEQVYWSHRIWPEENPGPKPPLATVLSDNDIQARVEDYLAKSNALETLWRRPVTAEQLQAEIDRMARDTHDPRVLVELFAALGNDPLVIAETLGRQSLADRLIRSWYANDTRFHADQPKQPFDAWWTAERKTQSTRVADEPFSFAFPEVVSAVCTTDSWQQTAGKIDPRANHTAVWTGTELIVWGGGTFGGNSTFGHYSNSGSRYNPSTDTWAPTSTTGAVPGVRAGHTAIWTGTRMIVWGGTYFDGISGHDVNTGGRYDPTTDSWSPTSTGANVPAPRSVHTAVWTGTEMIVWGGSTNSGGRYNPATDSWAATSTAAGVPSARGAHTAVWTGTQMIVWGGGTYLNTGGRYTPSTNSWTATSTGANVPAGRIDHTAVWTGSEMIVWGGNLSASTLFTNTGGRYNPSTDSWTMTSTGVNAPSARIAHTAVWAGSEMIVWGGRPNLGTAGLNTGARYAPGTDTWTSTSIGGNTPASRWGHTSVWTGTEMLVWGGASVSSCLGTGGRYSPSTDSWVPSAPVGDNAPAARVDFTSVWTGTEMIVWGGSISSGSSVSTSSGGRYAPATDSWTPTSLGANLPVERNTHVAVWTGSEMIVWGGNSVLSYPDTGGRYDPTTDSWVATAVGPTGRRGAVAVWTGTEMIVWGGYSGSYTNTGGRYDPSSDSWTPTSTGANAPGAREGHRAVWTGSEMIVWGGFSPAIGGYVNTGSRYRPSTDGWTLTSTGANVPLGRISHTAVWTGSEMIVWGGRLSSGAPVNSGGRYDPVGNSWLPTSTGANVPSARANHTASWTDGQMVVWGGAEDFGALGSNTGARWTPSTDTWMPTSTGLNVPSARTQHGATWTGSEMIVWGGPSLTGARYCVCLHTRTVYRDADGDGFGDAAQPAISNCDGSVQPGFDDDAMDCNDANATVHPGAPEVNDGIDNQCAGSAGFGVIDEISGVSGFVTAGDKTLFSWTPQAGATSYDVVRSTASDFSSGCTTFSSSDPFVSDPASPAAGGAFYYLVRPAAPHVGSWGQHHDGSPRGGGCLTP